MNNFCKKNKIKSIKMHNGISFNVNVNFYDIHLHPLGIIMHFLLCFVFFFPISITKYPTIIQNNNNNKEKL